MVHLLIHLPHEAEEGSGMGPGGMGPGGMGPGGMGPGFGEMPPEPPM